MLIFAVDDEEIQLAHITDCMEKIMPNGELKCFASSFDALSAVKNGARPEICLLDIHMDGIDGIELAKEIKKYCPKSNIIFCTGYSEYAVDAFGLGASGYLLKPVSAEDLKDQIEMLRYPVKQHSSSNLQAYCFGNFEVFANGRPIQFQHMKTKELLAYLIDRKGALCTVNDISNKLWGDESHHRSYFKIIRKDLLDTLSQYGIEDLIVVRWGQLGIDRTKINCDYYDWLDNKPDGVLAYHGEYMTNYPWAEATNRNLWGQK